jgi:DNA-binding transcriptional LysR family regulator
MSRALARLRDVLGDPLLVKAPGGFAPTARALALAPRVSEALDRIVGLYREPEFSPAALRRSFRIAAADSQTVLLAPPLLRRTRALAPEADLRFESYGADFRARFEAGALDLAFAVATTPLPPGVVSELIAEDRLALVMRRGHPAAGRRWAKADYADFDHVTVSVRGGDDSEIDAELAEAGVTRRVVLRTPYFMAALASVGATDCVTTLSAALARRFADTFGLILAEPPLAQTLLRFTLVGMASRGADPAAPWLRARIREAADEVYRD